MLLLLKLWMNLGLMNVDEKKYSQIISAAGGILTEAPGREVKRIANGKAPTLADVKKYSAPVRSRVNAYKHGQQAEKFLRDATDD